FTLFNMGIALICARITVHVRDFTQILPILTRVLFYTSGVLFSADRLLNEWPWMIAIFDIHPLYQTLQIARGLIMNDAIYDAWAWPLVAAWSVITLLVGLIYFWKA
ncbi:phosphate ABC transporter permease, partial [Escherichia coli]|nr:phosphate ABC transporter permease [Escherichia coli]